MPHQNVPSVLKVEMRYQTPDNIVENVYYVKSSASTWAEADIDAAVAAFQNWEDLHASDDRSNMVSLFEIIATDLTSLFGIRKSYAVSPAIPGTLPSEALPANATYAIKASIGRRGRGVNGRTFWVGLAEDQTAGNKVNTSAVDSIVADLELLRTSVGALTDVECMAIPHFTVAGVKPSTVSSDCIVRFTASDIFVDSQKNRLPEHRRRKRTLLTP